MEGATTEEIVGPLVEAEILLKQLGCDCDRRSVHLRPNDPQKLNQCVLSETENNQGKPTQQHMF